MSGGGLLKSGIELLHGTQSAKRESSLLTDAAGLAHDKSVIAAVEDAGLAGSADEAAAQARRLETAVNTYDKTEQAVKAATDGSSTSLRWLRRITKPVKNRELGELWDRFSPRDTMKLLGEMIRRADEGKAVIHNFVAGAIREIVAKHLAEIRQIVIAEKLRIRELGKRGHNVSFIDTGAMGDVYLPTKTLSAEGRGIELGTDRIIGIARGKPQKVTIKRAGEEVEITVQGELEITVAIEVKGRSTAEAGVKQVEALTVQGRGTQGYAVIDGKFWLLRYDASKVNHVVVAPPGSELSKIRGVTKLSSGGTLTVAEIPIELDNQVLGMAGSLIKELQEDLKAAGEVLNKGKRPKLKK